MRPELFPRPPRRTVLEAAWDTMLMVAEILMWFAVAAVGLLVARILIYLGSVSMTLVAVLAAVVVGLLLGGAGRLPGQRDSRGMWNLPPCGICGQQVDAEIHKMTPEKDYQDYHSYAEEADDE